MLGVNFGLRLEQVRKTLSKKLNTSDQPLRDIGNISHRTPSVF